MNLLLAKICTIITHFLNRYLHIIDFHFLENANNQTIHDSVNQIDLLFHLNQVKNDTQKSYVLSLALQKEVFVNSF